MNIFVFIPSTGRLLIVQSSDETRPSSFRGYAFTTHIGTRDAPSHPLKPVGSISSGFECPPMHLTQHRLVGRKWGTPGAFSMLSGANSGAQARWLRVY